MYPAQIAKKARVTLDYFFHVSYKDKCLILRMESSKEQKILSKNEEMQTTTAARLKEMKRKRCGASGTIC